MFTIKERRYKIKYEGLHLLYTMCGRFGHYKEGCPDKVVQRMDPQTNDASKVQGMKGKSTQSQIWSDRPWSVLQQTRQSKKAGGSVGNNGKS